MNSQPTLRALQRFLAKQADAGNTTKQVWMPLEMFNQLYLELEPTVWGTDPRDPTPLKVPPKGGMEFIYIYGPTGHVSVVPVVGAQAPTVDRESVWFGPEELEAT